MRASRVVRFILCVRQRFVLSDIGSRFANWLFVLAGAGWTSYFFRTFILSCLVRAVRSWCCYCFAHASFLPRVFRCAATSDVLQSHRNFLVEPRWAPCRRFSRHLGSGPALAIPSKATLENSKR